MSKILGVKFRPTSKVYYYLPGNNVCKVNDHVIARTLRGVLLGKVVNIIDTKENSEIVSENELDTIIKVADKKDILHNEVNKQKALVAKQICISKAQKYNLKMKIVDVEYTFDRQKILFYFGADGKVDFRNLVRDLAFTLKAKIEMRQISVRDETRILNGLGICGRPFCCATFLSDVGSVSIKMAKDQNLSLNPGKLSGACGRLMCCLQYEQEAYEDLIANSPSVGNDVKTPDGPGQVIDVSLILGKVKVVLSRNNENTIKVYNKNDVQVIK